MAKKKLHLIDKTIHPDFNGLLRGDTVKMAWMIFCFFTFLAWACLGWMAGVTIALVFLLLPIIVKASYNANLEVYRQYTSIYREGRKHKCDVEMKVIEGDTIMYIVEVLHDGKRFTCEPMVHSAERLFSGNHMYETTFHPKTGFPLILERDGERIWVEARLFSSKPKLLPPPNKT